MSSQGPSYAPSRTPGSSSGRSGKSPARASRDSSRTRTVSESRRTQSRASRTEGKRVRFGSRNDDEASGAESRDASPERSRASTSSDTSSRGVCYAWRDHGRCSHGANCRFEHTPSDKGSKQRS